MEGKYTKAGTIIGSIGLLITIVVTVISFIPIARISNPYLANLFKIENPSSINKK